MIITSLYEIVAHVGLKKMPQGKSANHPEGILNLNLPYEKTLYILSTLWPNFLLTSAPSNNAVGMVLCILQETQIEIEKSTLSVIVQLSMFALCGHLREGGSVRVQIQFRFMN